MQIVHRPIADSVVIVEGVDLDGLIRAHSKRLYNFVRRRIGNPADVDDLVQDTYVEALRCAGKFHGHSRPETWLFGIAMNLVRNYYKRARLHDIFDYGDYDELRLVAMEDPMDLIERKQTIFKVAHVLDQMPHETQYIFSLIFDDHCSYDDVARNLSVPVGTIRSRISRARALLKDRTGY